MFRGEYVQLLARGHGTQKISFISTRYENEIFSFEIKYLAPAFCKLKRILH